MYDLSGIMLACAKSRSDGVVLNAPVTYSTAFLCMVSIFHIAAFMLPFFLEYVGLTACEHHMSAAFSMLGIATL